MRKKEILYGGDIMDFIYELIVNKEICGEGMFGAIVLLHLIRSVTNCDSQYLQLDIETVVLPEMEQFYE